MPGLRGKSWRLDEVVGIQKTQPSSVSYVFGVQNVTGAQSAGRDYYNRAFSHSFMGVPGIDTPVPAYSIGGW